MLIKLISRCMKARVLTRDFLQPAVITWSAWSTWFLISDRHFHFSCSPPVFFLLILDLDLILIFCHLLHSHFSCSSCLFNCSLDTCCHLVPSFPSGPDCSCVSICALGKTRAGKNERNRVPGFVVLPVVRGKSDKSWHKIRSRRLYHVQPLTNGHLMTLD